LSKNRTKNIFLKKFQLQIIFQIFEFVRFSDNFQHFLIFRKFPKFSKLSPEDIHASHCECLTLSLPDSVSISPGCCLPRCLQQQASAGIDVWTPRQTLFDMPSLKCPVPAKNT
jgi:hypothetical protein